MTWKMLGKKDNLGIVKKISIHSALISSPGRWTGNNIIFKGGLNGVSVGWSFTESYPNMSFSTYYTTQHTERVLRAEIQNSENNLHSY